jgi:hypothetical protein
MTVPSTLQLRIGRLTIDAAAMEGLSRRQVREQLVARLPGALARQFSGQTTPEGAPGLADHVASTVAPQVRARLPAPGAGGRRGTA